jgi:hypothetical protein
MTDLRKAAEMALEVLTLINQDFEKHRATLPIGRQSELCKASLTLRQALAQTEKPPVKSYCGGKPNYCTPEVTPDVDAVNMTQERVDETAKREHEPFIYVREDNERPFGGYEHCSEADAGAFPVYTAPMIYTPPPKREWVGLTDEEIIKCFDSVAFGQVEDDLIINKHVNIFRAIHGIEAKLKEKNT